MHNLDLVCQCGVCSIKIGPILSVRMCLFSVTLFRFALLVFLHYPQIYGVLVVMVVYCCSTADAFLCRLSADEKCSTLLGLCIHTNATFSRIFLVLIFKIHFTNISCHLISFLHALLFLSSFRLFPSTVRFFHGLTIDDKAHIETDKCVFS